MGGYNSLPFSPSASNAARNPILENIDKAAATGDLTILGPREHEAIKRSGITLANAAPAPPQQITNPRPAPPALAPQPAASPAMPLPGGIRGNASNNFTTTLSPGEEPQFQAWKAQFAPKDSGEDYDLQGAYKYGLTPDPKTGHWSDRFKKPNEPTFSNESQYAQDVPEKAGHWSGPNRDIYVPPAPMSENLPNGQSAMMAGTGITMPTPRPQPVPPTAAAAPAQKELERLTVGPEATAGVNQIHNPWARVPLQILAGIGETFAPRLAAALPGTESHHQLLVGEAENAVKQQQGIREAEEKARTAASEEGLRGAQVTNLEGEQPLHEAQTREANARAWSLLNPAEKAGELGKTVQTDQGILQLNPETGRYDIFVGGAPSKEGGTVHQLDDGTLIIAKPDGKGVLVTVDGQPVKGKVTQAGESTDVKNYTFAKEQGYQGTFEQWQKDEANRKTPHTNIINQGDKLLTPGEAAMLGVPYGTTREAAAGRQPATEAQKSTGNYATRIKQSNDVINGIEKQVAAQGAVGQGIQSILPNALKSDLTQSYEQAQRNFINAVLRRESGAVISPSEFSEARKQYFPQPGDSAGVLAQKRANRETVQKNLIRSAGNAYEEPPTLTGGANEGGAGSVPTVGETFQGGKVLKVTKIK